MWIGKITFGDLTLNSDHIVNVRDISPVVSLLASEWFG